MLKNGQWIWADAPHEVNQYARFEAEFFADDPRGISAQICVSGEYALYINDHMAGFGQFGNWPEFKTYNVHDVSGYCVPGRNRFVLVAWHMGIDCMVGVAGEGRVCFSLNRGDKVLMCSGEDTLCCVDERYRSGDSVPLISPQLGFSFEYDASAPKGRLRPAKLCPAPQRCDFRPASLLEMESLRRGVPCFRGCFEDEALPQARPAVRMMTSALAPLPNEATKEDARYVCERGDGICLIYDLERESAGYLSIDIELDGDTLILIGWGEHLKDLRVRTAVGGRNFCAVYHGAKGRNRFVHPFRRMGCRYIQMHVYGKAVKVNHVGLIPVIYPMRERSRLNIADEMHRRIYETAVDTLELCLHDHYEDCPWREQALYAMDSRIQILCGYYAFSETAMPRASIELLAKGLRSDGLLEICAPAKASITIPCFSLAWIVELWEYVLYTGDAEVDEFIDTALTILDAMEDRRDAGGSLLRYREKQYWNFYEWQPGLDGDGPGRDADYDGDVQDGLLTAWYAIALDCCAQLLDAVGRDGKARDVRKRLDGARAALEHFWNEERGLYASVIRGGRKEIWSALMQSLALLSGACPEERAVGLRNRLKSQDGLVPVTLNDALLRYQALMQEERVYADFVFADIGRIWGKMLMEGATSFWETELGEADFHNAGSLCHGWSAVPVYFYHAYGMGIRPEAPGKMKRYPVYQRVLGKIE